MIRRPTTDPYAWWRAAVAGERPARSDGDIHAGFFRRRYCRGGPLVPVEVRLVQETDPDTGDLTAPEVFEAIEVGRVRVLTWPSDFANRLRPIPREEYESLLRRIEDIDAMTATHAPIDLSQTPIRPGG